MRVRLIVLTHGKELLIVAYVFSNYLHDLSQTVHAHYPKQEIFGKSHQKHITKIALELWHNRDRNHPPTYS